MPNVTLLPRTQAFGYYAQNFVGLAQRLTDHLPSPAVDAPRERMWKVRARQVVLATGAIERPLVFPDNDRPGHHAGFGRAHVSQPLRREARPGVVLFTADDSGYAAALDLAKAGVDSSAIADMRPAPDGPAVEAARTAGIQVMPATVITGTRGRLRVSGVTLGKLAADGSVSSSGSVACDLVLMAGGWTPSVHLFSQSRGKLRFDEAEQVFVPGQVGAGAALGRLMQRHLWHRGQPRGRRSRGRSCGKRRGHAGGRKNCKRRSHCRRRDRHVRRMAWRGAA